MTINRSLEIDILKAIGIFAIIIGHFNIAKQFVFSFHVPMFFIIGGYLFSPKTMIQEWKTDIKRLLIPYFITSLFILLWDALLAIRIKDGGIIAERMVEILLGGGTSQQYILLGTYGQIGAIWFLLALMVCRLVYNGLNRIVSNAVLSIVCLSLSISAILIYKYIGALPWDILQGLSALVLYDIGRKIRMIGGFEKIPIKMGILFVILWFMAICVTSISICSCRYNCYPLNIFGAIGATWFFWKICQKISNVERKWIRAIAWFGKNSLAVLCLHLFDLETGIIHKLQHWTVDWHYHNDYIHVILQIVIICGLIYGWDKVKEKYKKNLCKNS